MLFPGQAIGLAPTEVSLAAAASAAPATARRWSASGTAATSRRSCRPTTASTTTSACPTATTWAARSSGAARAPLAPDYPPLPLLLDDDVIEQQPDQASLTERYVAEARALPPRVRRDEPFFLYLAHMYVHLPIYVQERFADSSRNGAYGAAVEAIDWATEVILARAPPRSASTTTRS